MTHKDTYEYCEQLIDDQLNSLLNEGHMAVGQTLQEYKQELKDLYKHLENIQNMKTSYISGR
jgi:ATP-dependent Zn protease